MTRGLIATVLGSGLGLHGDSPQARSGGQGGESPHGSAGHDPATASAVSDDFIDLAANTSGDCIELRLDAWAAAWRSACGAHPSPERAFELVSRVRASCSKTLFVACPGLHLGRTQGAAPELDVDSHLRFDYLLEAARAGCDWVDVDADSSPGFFARAESQAPASLGSVKVLLSSHFALEQGAGTTAQQLDRELDSLLGIQTAQVAIGGIKIVGHAMSITTAEPGLSAPLAEPGAAGLELLYWLRKSRQRWRSRGLMGVVFAGESGGAFTRTLAPALGSDFVFAAADGGRRVPGQITAAEQLICWPRGYPKEDTAIFGVLGFPVAASLSPQLFTGLFRLHKVDAVFGRIEVQDPQAAFRFLELAEVSGLSVTAPHKGHAHKFAQDNLAPGARRLGAVNTLGRGPDDGPWWGANTDVEGVRHALGLGSGGLPKDQTAVVLGAGGAARAVLGALSGPGSGRVIVLARRPKAALALAREFGASVFAPEDLPGATPDLLIHTTPAGSRAQPGAMAMSQLALEALAKAAPKCVVLDAIYSPRETPLMAQARALGLEARNGLQWFLGQGLAQFHLFTGMAASAEAAKSLVEGCLARPWIVLIGLRGSGKSSLGALLAERLGLPFVDLDQEIASAAGVSSAGLLLERDGEPLFRAAEASVLGDVLQRPIRGVLATGGGVVEGRACRALLGSADSWCVLLTADPRELERRVAGDPAHRPPLASLGGQAQLEETGLSEAQIAWQRRGPVLEGIADVTLDSEGRSPKELASALEHWLPRSFLE